ncbi:dGTP triphosphohydrolase [uncultured Methylobacterium sp.]|uniref:dGTP triphosphohydrolase n=1 Tax=uncultured Methylobacterium sp. TaxID=157278 RepID=UPI0035CAF167
MSEDTEEPNDGHVQGGGGRRRARRGAVDDFQAHDREERGAVGSGEAPPLTAESQAAGEAQRAGVILLYQAADWDRELPNDAEEPWRRAVARDWARVTHSVSFRRLQGKTQVFPGHESDYFRNRLTHSLEVAQIAEGIADKLNHENKVRFGDCVIDAKLCATAALLHDLGHPPFGHNGERALDDRMRQYGGFEGNAQTIRIISRLEKKSWDQNQVLTNEMYKNDRRLGLNLSYRTIAATLKYDKEIPPTRSGTEKLVKGYYASESDLVKRVKAKVDPKWQGKFKTVECAIMDIADDIAYSTYDLEDCLKAGFITPADILASDDTLLKRVAQKVRENLLKDTGKDIKISPDDVLLVFYDVFEAILPDFKTARGLVMIPKKQMLTRRVTDAVKLFKASRELASSGYGRTALSSQLVNEAIKSVYFEYNDKHPALSRPYLTESSLIKIEVLKQYTYEATIYSTRVKVSEYRGYDVVQGIFDALASDRGYLLMPEDLRKIYKSVERNASERMRSICDFVAGMTDRYALEFYARLYSDDAQSIFKPI